MKTKYYDHIDNLPLYNFDKFLHTKDDNWFIIDYDGRQKKQQSKELKNIEDDILEQYFEAIKDNSFVGKMQKWAQINFLQTKYCVVVAMVERMYKGFEVSQQDMRYQFVMELKKHGFKMPIINTEEGEREELKRIYQEVQGIKTQIHLIERELQTDGKKESQSLAKQIKIAELSLGSMYGHQIRINPKTTMTSEWIEIIKTVEEQAKKN